MKKYQKIADSVGLSIEEWESKLSDDGEFILIKGGCKQYINDHIKSYGLQKLITEVGSDLITEELKHIIGEKTYKDLRIDAPKFLNIRVKSKETPGSRYITIDEDNICHFKTASHTHPGVVYDQRVKLLKLDKLIRQYSGIKKPIEIIRMALEEDIAVHCTDPSWKYWGFQYIGTRKKYATEPEPRYPKIRNPNLKGSVCKHLDNVLFILPFQNSKIMHDLRKQERL